MTIFSRQNPHFPPKIYRQNCLFRTFLAITISSQKPLLPKRPESRSAVEVFNSRQNIHSAHFSTKTWSFGGKTFWREDFDMKIRKMHTDNCIPQMFSRQHAFTPKSARYKHCNLKAAPDIAPVTLGCFFAKFPLCVRTNCFFRALSHNI